jgi:RNA polymerase sigma-70 factor (ECF subfamily)
VTEPDDPDLARLAAGGDRQAFTRLAGRHKTWLFRFIRRYVGNGDEAYDLLQDTLVAAWLALHRYDPDRPFQAWLRQIALNKCRDWSRRTSLRRLVFTFTANPDALAAELAGSNPEMQLTADQLLSRLDQAIASLPVALREPFILTAFEGLSHRETAQQLRVSEKAVETRVYRARRRLAKIVDRADLTFLIDTPAHE